MGKARKQSERVQVFPEGDSLAKQSAKDSADINQIVERHRRTGQVPLNTRQGVFMDCTGADFKQAADLVAEGKSAFMELPGKVRARFENDPAKFLDFVQDEANAEECVEMGIFKDVKREPVDQQETQEAENTPKEDPAQETE